MKVQSYLFFAGHCEEALAFYRQALGAEVTQLMRFRDSPDPLPPGMVPPGSEDKVMHAAFRVGETEVMASDGHCGGNPAFKGISLALSLPGAAEAERVFGALAEGGRVTMPLGRTFFSPSFGVVADRFGVEWMVMAEAA